MIARRRWIAAALVALIGVGVAALLVQQLSPATTGVSRNCLSAEQADDCLRLPTISGENLSGQSATFPDAFAHDLNLVIMPFDRDQQVQAIDWLPIFAALADENPAIAYYSLAALPDLAPAVRLLVSGGMRAAVSDEAIRQLSYLFYLEDQAALLAALEIADTSAMQVLIFDAAGDVLWRASGADIAATTPDLQQAVADLR